MTTLLRLLRSDRAATAIEYGLLVALIFIAALGGMRLFGTNAINMWNEVSGNL